jgi:hypothetical protein
MGPTKLLKDEPESIIYISSHVDNRPSPVTASLITTLVLLGLMQLIAMVFLRLQLGKRLSRPSG